MVLSKKYDSNVSSMYPGLGAGGEGIDGCCGATIIPSSNGQEAATKEGSS